MFDSYLHVLKAHTHEIDSKYLREQLFTSDLHITMVRDSLEEIAMTIEGLSSDLDLRLINKKLFILKSGSKYYLAEPN